ncbi:MAG: hypothetical protein NTX50_30710 [Candidatus Sumerlaeota bacterium]|nr:hypothetical protein [Candidatus Sumerlaeota bacterium]
MKDEFESDDKSLQVRLLMPSAKAAKAKALSFLISHFSFYIDE